MKCQVSPPADGYIVSIMAFVEKSPVVIRTGLSQSNKFDISDQMKDYPLWVAL